MSAGTSRPRALARALLQAGLWSATGRVVPIAENGAAVVGDPGNRRDLLRLAWEEKMVPMVAAFADSVGCDVGTAPQRTAEVCGILTRVLYEQAAPALAGLGERGVKFAVIKGADLDLAVYRRSVSRFMWDVDILVRPTDVPAVVESFHQAGYVQGDLNASQLVIEPLSAEEKESREAGRHEIWEFSKLVPVPELAPYADLIEEHQPAGSCVVVGADVYMVANVDVHITLSTDFDLRDVWVGLRELDFPGVGPVAAQSFADIVWYLAVRMYHELHLSNEPGMRYFVDLVAVVDKRGAEVDWQRLMYMCGKYKLHPSLFFVLWHIDEVLGGGIPGEVIDFCRPTGAAADRRHDWGDFVPRMLGEVSVTPMLLQAAGDAWHGAVSPASPLVARKGVA